VLLNVRRRAATHGLPRFARSDKAFVIASMQISVIASAADIRHRERSVAIHRFGLPRFARSDKASVIASTLISVIASEAWRSITVAPCAKRHRGE
jgi:hypothetical protein